MLININSTENQRVEYPLRVGDGMYLPVEELKYLDRLVNEWGRNKAGRWKMDWCNITSVVDMNVKA